MVLEKVRLSDTKYFKRAKNWDSALYLWHHNFPQSMDYGATWIPLQYYSSQCRKVYERPFKMTITKSNEQEPRCTDHFRGDLNSIQSSRIAFSTLEGRPSAADFDSSPVLQEWVTATDIRVVFNRLHSPVTYMTTNSVLMRQQAKNNKYSGESKESAGAATNTGSPTLMQTASVNSPLATYSLSDFAVGGRCKCNGHASKCSKTRDGEELACECKHGTMGRECERCKPFHNDRPWARATARDANECKGKKKKKKKKCPLHTHQPLESENI